MARQSIVRPVRTAVQLAPAAVITEFADAFIYDMNDKQYAALAGVLLLVFSYSQNLYEELKNRRIPKDTTVILGE